VICTLSSFDKTVSGFSSLILRFHLKRSGVSPLWCSSSY